MDILNTSRVPNSLKESSGKHIGIRRVFPRPIVLNKAMKDKVPIVIQEAQRHINNDTFFLYDALAKKDGAVHNTTIISESTFPSCLSCSDATIINQLTLVK